MNSGYRDMDDLIGKNKSFFAYTELAQVRKESSVNAFSDHVVLEVLVLGPSSGMLAGWSVVSVS